LGQSLDGAGEENRQPASDLRSERDPIKRLIVQRELALQYVYGGTAEPGIALLEKLLVDYGKSLPVRDIETLKAISRSPISVLGAAELHLESQFRRLHLSHQGPGRAQGAPRRGRGGQALYRAAVRSGHRS